eukprot:14168703-Alexandrium_andersonii.AAC.1
MSASLVGSEMCIRDSADRAALNLELGPGLSNQAGDRRVRPIHERPLGGCLLYTSDAADDM